MTSHDPGSRRPEPTRLVLLDQVRLQASGSKIRFLGCVYEYRGNSATLVLKGDFTKPEDVKVKIDNVLESVNHEILAVGSWLNIIGYVRNQDIARSSISNGSRRSTRSKRPVVHATMLWSAGPIRLDKYESAARAYQSTTLVDE